MAGSIMRGLEPVPLSTIMKAKKKPDGVSDRRWRMELARRKQKGFGESEQALKPILVWESVRKRNYE